MKNNKTYVLRITQGAMIAALAYIGFQFLRIDIPVGTEKTAFHLGNTFVVLGSLLLGGPWGGIAGALGLTLADLTSGYATSAPKTFILKLLIGLIAGLLAHKVFHIEKAATVKEQFRAALISSIAALGFNVIADPLAGYFYKTYIFGIPQDMSAALAKISSLTTLVNAVLSVICVCVIWSALYPALHRANLLIWQRKAPEPSEPVSEKASNT